MNGSSSSPKTGCHSSTFQPSTFQSSTFQSSTFQSSASGSSQEMGQPVSKYQQSNDSVSTNRPMSTNDSVSTNRPLSIASSSIVNGSSMSTAVPGDRLVVCPFCDPLIPRKQLRRHLTKHMSCSIVCLPCESSLVENRIPCSVHEDVDTVVDQSQIPALKAWMKEYINGCDRLLDQSVGNGSGQSIKSGSGQSIKSGSGQSIKSGSSQSIKSGSSQSINGQSINSGSSQSAKKESSQSAKNGSNRCIKNLSIKFLKICNFCTKLKDCGYIFGDVKNEDTKNEDTKKGNANLRDTNLRDTNLRDANLRDANLRDANLRDANLRDANQDDYSYISRENFENHVRIHLCYFYCTNRKSDTWASRIITNDDQNNRIDKLDELIRIMVGNYTPNLVPNRDLVPFDCGAEDDLVSDSPMIVDDDKSDANNDLSAISIEKMDEDSVISIPQDGDSRSKYHDTCLKDGDTNPEDGACVKTDPYAPPSEHIEAMERLKSLVLKLERVDGAKKYNVIRDANLVLSPEEIEERRRNKRKLFHDPYRDVQVIRREIEMLVPEHYPSEDDANLAPDASSKSDANLMTDANSSEANSKSGANTSTSNATYFCLFCKQSAGIGNKKKKALNTPTPTPTSTPTPTPTSTPTTSGVQEVDGSILTEKTAVEHYYKHLKYYPYQCSICKEMTPTEIRMKQHIKEMHDMLQSVWIIHECHPGIVLWVDRFLSSQRMGTINKSLRGIPLTVHSCCPVCLITVKEEELKSVPFDRIRNGGILSHVCAHLNYYSYKCIRCSFPYNCATANYTLFEHVINHHPEAMNEPLDTTFNRSLAIKSLDSFIINHLKRYNITTKFTMQIFIPKATIERHRATKERHRATKERHRAREENKAREEKLRLERVRVEEGKVMNGHCAQSGMSEDAHVMIDSESEHASKKSNPYDPRLNVMSNDQFHSKLLSGRASSSGPTLPGGLGTTLLHPRPIVSRTCGSQNLAPNSSASQSFPSTLQSLLGSAQRPTAYQVSIDGKPIGAKMLASNQTLANQQRLSSNSASNLNLASRNNSLLVAPPGANQVVSTSNDVLGLVKTLKPPSHERQIMTLDLDPSNFNLDAPELGQDVLPNFNYFCIFCPKVDQSIDLESKDEAIAHYGKHLEYYPVICLLCSRKFTNLMTLYIHHEHMHQVNGSISTHQVNGSISTSRMNHHQQVLYILNEDVILERWIDSFLRLQKSSHIFNLIQLVHLDSCIVCQRLIQTYTIRGQACPISDQKGSSQSSEVGSSQNSEVGSSQKMTPNDKGPSQNSAIGSSQKMTHNDKGPSSNFCDKKPKNAGSEVSLDHIYSHLGYAPYECILCSYEGIVTKFSVVDDHTYQYQNRRQNSNQLIGKPDETKSGTGTPSDENRTGVPSNETPIETDAKEKAAKIATHAPDNIKAINHLETVHGLTDSDLDMEIVPKMFIKRFSIDKLEEAVHAHLIMAKFSKLIKPRDGKAARQEAQDVLWDSDYEEDYEPAPPGDGKKRKAWIPEVALKSSSVCCLHCHAHVSTIKKLKRHHYSIHPQLSIATYSPGNVEKVRLI